MRRIINQQLILLLCFEASTLTNVRKMLRAPPSGARVPLVTLQWSLAKMGQ